MCVYVRMDSERLPAPAVHRALEPARDEGGYAVVQPGLVHVLPPGPVQVLAAAASVQTLSLSVMILCASTHLMDTSTSPWTSRYGD